MLIIVEEQNYSAWASSAFAHILRCLLDFSCTLQNVLATTRSSQSLSEFWDQALFILRGTLSKLDLAIVLA